MERFTLHHGDCLAVLKTLPDNSVDSIVTDPPYGLSKEPDMAEVLRHWLAGDDYQHKGGGFMGKSWDSFVPGPSVWRECLRVLKPGGHLLAFFGARTQDLGTLAIRLAGFEIRDSIAWMYGSGFPKNMDVSKQIDKMAGAAREVISEKVKHLNFDPNSEGGGGFKRGTIITSAPATDAAKQWEGWGTALKPAHEPITMARKPFKGSVTANVLAHGTGALNIDACRIQTNPLVDAPRLGGSGTWKTNNMASHAYSEYEGREVSSHTGGRWPANLIHDGSDAVMALFPQSSQTGKRSATSQAATVEGTSWGTNNHQSTEYTDSGSTARFFYCPKASPKDRREGLDAPGPQFEHGATLRKVENTATKGNNHPTVKPTELMAYLCRLVTPAGGVVLDPFMGSGSTGKAAMREGFQFIGIEREDEYVDIARSRITAAVV
ncbi:DNA-methyltransferase [Pantoea septica]|uniref:DNA-methyltransferase n=1 Tax=Pantoea septica TaxID=472695 RepID=UPI0023F8DEC2|nr:site-specific DNA-methyltransferase [Pantoea septica]